MQFLFFFVFKQKTAYEMRISDWSSDVCSSDLADVRMRIFNADGSEVDACGNATRCIPLFLGRDCRIETNAGLLNAELHGGGASVDMGQIGRASCRERVCQYV